jgi:APA family basic amino acid/polyamine antiporter
MSRLAGPAAGALWSGATVVVFLSAMSAMIFLGPRVYAAMARDGFLPAFLAGKGEHPPRAAVLLQGGLALLIVLTQELQAALALVGGVLMIFAALTAAGLVVARLQGRAPRPSGLAVGAAAAYVLISGWLFVSALTNPFLPGTPAQRLLGIGVLLGVGRGGYLVSRRRGAALTP